MTPTPARTRLARATLGRRFAHRLLAGMRRMPASRARGAGSTRGTTRLLPMLALLAACALPLTARGQANLVRLHTTHGPLDMTLLASEAPITVANFLAYARAGDYNEVFFHRSARLQDGSPFVIQSGGYAWGPSNSITAVPSRGTIVNEFSATRSNLRGTVAMAKVGGDPNSATSQWFINMRANTFLDADNGGFTVFARMTTPSMAVADAIAALPRVNAGGVFSELPVSNWTAGTSVTRANVVRIFGVTEFPPNPGEADRIFNYIEATYPQYASPWNATTAQALGYTYRYYANTDAYLGVKDGQLWYHVPALGTSLAQPGRLGTVTDWLGVAQAAGY